jgi:hypothetical protein
MKSGNRRWNKLGYIKDAKLWNHGLLFWPRTLTAPCPLHGLGRNIDLETSSGPAEDPKRLSAQRESMVLRVDDGSDNIPMIWSNSNHSARDYIPPLSASYPSVSSTLIKEHLNRHTTPSQQPNSPCKHLSRRKRLNKLPKPLILFQLTPQPLTRIIHNLLHLGIPLPRLNHNNSLNERLDVPLLEVRVFP